MSKIDLGPHIGACSPGNSSCLAADDSEIATKAKEGQDQSALLKLSPPAPETLTRPVGSYGLGFGPSLSEAARLMSLRKQRAIIFDQFIYFATCASDSDRWRDEQNVVHYAREIWLLNKPLTDIMAELWLIEGRVL